MMVSSVMNTTNLPCKSNILLSPNVDWSLCTLPWGLSSFCSRHYCLISLAFTSFCLSHYRFFAIGLYCLFPVFCWRTGSLCFAYQIRGVVLYRKVWNKAFGDHELSTRGIITFFFNPNFNVVFERGTDTRWG